MKINRSVFLATVIFLAATCFTFSQAEAQQKGTIICKVLAFRNTNGNIQMTLYNQEEGFPEDLETSLETKIIKIDNRDVMEMRFTNLPFGTYSLAGLHDENYNKDMDYNWIGMPKEGYCFSQDAKPVLSSPSYDATKFKLDKKAKIVYITMQY